MNLLQKRKQYTADQNDAEQGLSKVTKVRVSEKDGKFIINNECNNQANRRIKRKSKGCRLELVIDKQQMEFEEEDDQISSIQAISEQQSLIIEDLFEEFRNDEI